MRVQHFVFTIRLTEEGFPVWNYTRIRSIAINLVVLAAFGAVIPLIGKLSRAVGTYAGTH